MKFRPTAKTLRLSFFVFFVVLIMALLLAPTGGKTKELMFYSPRWSNHDSNMDCAACHRPFRKVQSFDCVSQKCHPDYQDSYNVDDYVVYTEEVLAIDDTRARLSREEERRAHHAHLVYHRLPDIKAMNCSECHPEHLPPPNPDGFAFTHQPGRFMPESISYVKCSTCHTPAEAPDTPDHSEYLNGSTADCWACHFSHTSWNHKAIYRDPANAGSH